MAQWETIAKSISDNSGESFSVDEQRSVERGSIKCAYREADAARSYFVNPNSVSGLAGDVRGRGIAGGVGQSHRGEQTGARPVAPENRYCPPFKVAYLGPRFWSTWLGFGFLWLMSITPRTLRIGLARWLGGVVMRRNAKRREIVQTNLEWCFPEKSDAEREAMAQEYFRYFVQAILDTGLFWWGSKQRFRRNIVLEGDAQLAETLAAGKRVIIVTCHTLALDRGGVALSADYPFETFVNEARNPLVEWMSARRRVRFDGLVFPRSGGLRPVIRALRQGYALYILTDEDLGPESSVYAPFFGIPRATLTTPSRLSKMSGAEVFTSLTYYDDEAGRYVVKLYPRLEEFPSGDEQADATRLNGIIEQMIRERPEQYMWSLRLFQTLPDGAPPPYTMKGKPGSGPRPRPEFFNSSSEK